MNRTTRVFLVTLGLLAVGAGAFLFTPYGRALAGTASAPWAYMSAMMGGDHAALHQQHMAQYGGNMAAMHSAMGGQMAGMHAAMGGQMGAMHAAMGPLMADMPAIHAQVTGALAQKLGMSPEALAEALEGGQTLAALAEEKGVKAGELQGAMVAAMEQAVNSLVQAGQLQPADAARIRAELPQHAVACLTTDMTGMMGAMAAMLSAGGTGR